MPRHAWWLLSFLVLAAWMLVAPALGSAAPNAAPLLALTDTPSPPATPTKTTPPTNTPVTATSTATRGTLTPTNTPVTTPPTKTPQPKHESTPTPTAPPTPTPPPTGDPNLHKSVDPSSGFPGDKITFTIVARNDSPIPATDVVVDDSIPGVFEITGASTSQGTVDVSGQHIHAVIGTIPPGGAVTIRITTVIRADALPGQVDNVAVMTTTTPGDNPGNNTSIVTVTIPGPPPPARLPRTGVAAPWLVLPALLAFAALVAGLALRARRRA